MSQEGEQEMKLSREWIIRICVLLAAGVWLTLVAASWAESAEPTSGSVTSNDEYNFSWLDPEKKIYVLQNRKYAKSEHVVLSAMVGTTSFNPYRNTFTIDPRLAYYFSESFGLEAFYTVGTNAANATFNQLTAASPNALPNVRELRGQYGLLAQWVPWYAKINVFNNILHFDWYFSGGAGQLMTALDTRPNTNAAPAYLMQNYTAFYAGTGHQYHLNQNFSVRLDVTGTYYKAPTFGAIGDTVWFSNYIIGIGLGYRI